MTKLPPQLSALNDAILALGNAHGFTQAKAVVDAVTALLGIDSGTGWKPFTDSQGKIRSNAGWFMEAEGFADRRAVYKIADNEKTNLDLKAYWTHKTKKSVISWLVALTPNFEDEPFYQTQNIGIDFIIPEKADRVIVVLSKNYVIRTMELQGQLSVTQQEIFAKWLTGFDFSNKAQVHELLWQSFDIEPLNKRFYKEISSLFIELEQHLATTKLFDERHAAYFANRLIGRIIFCWFLDKKGLINPEAAYFETSGVNATDYYHGKLETLFFKVFNMPQEEREKGVERITPYLNGGLFEAKDGDKFGNPSVTFPADYFDRLIGLLRHYNFTTDESTSTFQQVAIDPEMLGRIFENLLAEQVEETGEQARKAKGAFYTPREIVDYMCRESLREYLKSKLPKLEDRDQRISQLLDSKEHEWSDQKRNYRQDLKPYKHDILKALDDLKVIDPACGSGAFPMGMLHMLLQVYERLEPDFDPYKKKLSIIRENLYGVDIEPMAVEISRLRAWLSIVVEEENVEPLPNLDFKFLCANSLFALDKGENQTLFRVENLEEDLQKLREDYFNPKYINEKKLIKGRFSELIQKARLNEHGSKRENQLKTYQPFDEENITGFFDGDFMFGVKGFDIVIANPPYITVSLGKKQKIFNQEEINTLKEIYSDIFEYKGNTFSFFIKKGINLLNNNGTLVFIIPNTLLLNSTFKKVREYILKTSNILKLINIKEKVFESAEIGGSLILSLIREKPQDKMVETCEISDLNTFGHYLKMTSIDSSIFTMNPEFKLNINIKNIDLLHKIYLNTKPLGEIVKFYQGIITGDNNKFLAKKKIDRRYEKILRGKDIHKYFYKFNENFILFDKNLLWSNTNEKLFKSSQKLISRQTSDSLIASYDDQGLFTLDSTHIQVPIDDNYNLKYILALFNSALLNFCYQNIVQETGRVFAQVKTVNLFNLPIKIIPLSKQKSFIEVVDHILVNTSAKKFDPNKPPAEQFELERKIDEMVFDLYGLTIEEREIVLHASS